MLKKKNGSFLLKGSNKKLRLNEFPVRFALNGFQQFEVNAITKLSNRGVRRFCGESFSQTNNDYNTQYFKMTHSIKQHSSDTEKKLDNTINMQVSSLQNVWAAITSKDT